MERKQCYAQMKDGTQIYYEKIGSGSPLFLLHGNGNSGTYFSQQVPEFSKQYQVFLVDSRGHGKSTNTQYHLNFQLMADDLKEIMDQENIKSADILGFSDGANLAMVFASSYPSYVHRLILNAGNIRVHGLYWYSRIGSWIECFAIFLASLFSKRAKAFLPIIDLLLHDLPISFDDLKKINSQTLVIVGKNDVVKTSHSMSIARNIPHASFVLVSGQGHHFSRKNPERFNQEVLNFLSDHNQ